MISLLRSLMALISISGGVRAALAQPSGPQGTLAVANKVDGTASFIDVATGATKTVKVGHLPHEVAIGNGFAYVSNYGSAHIRSSDLRNQPGNTISVVSLSEPSTVSEIDMGPARCAPHGLAISRDGNWLYATCEGRGEIAVIDLKSHSLSHTLPTNQAGSHLLVLSADDTKAYVSNFWHGTVSVIDLKKRRLVEQIFTGRGTEGIGLSLDDRFLFVTRVEENELVKIDTKTLKIVDRKSLPQGSSPIRVWSSPSDANHIVVNNVGRGTLQIFDVEMKPINEIKVGRQPIGLATSNTHYAFVANMKDNNIGMINLLTGQIERTFSTGAAPDGIAFRP